jgi:hypothetical protein
MSKDVGETADAAAFAVIEPEQRKNSERNFFTLLWPDLLDLLSFFISVLCVTFAVMR